jgi:hypothetical protein
MASANTWQREVGGSTGKDALHDLPPDDTGVVNDHLPEPLTSTRRLDRPFIVAGDHAYLIGQQDGLFPDMGWHIPGEMGGIWAHPIKLLDGLWLRIDDTWLTRADQFVVGPYWAEHRYSLADGLQVVRQDFVPDGEPAVIVSYTFRSPVQRTLRLRLLARSDLRGVWLSERCGIGDGDDRAAFDARLGVWYCWDEQNPWHVVIGTPVLRPIAHEAGPELWGPERTTGRGISVALDYQLTLEQNETARVTWVIASSSHTPALALDCYRRVCAVAPALWMAKAKRYAAMLSHSRLQVPDVMLTRAWDWIKCNHDWLVRDVPPLGRGLGAGVADYVWWFGCDTCYAVRGCLALGQHEIAIETLDLIRRLSLAANGQTGRVIHECTTGGLIAHHGNTQETPHFVRTVWDTFLWTGDRSFLERNYDFCKRGLLEWTLGHQCDDGDLLPYGYGITEMEGLDLQCIDTAAFTVEALAALAGMAETLGEADVAQRCRSLFRVARDRLEAAFWLESEGLYGDMVATPAEMVPRLHAWITHTEKTDPQAAAIYRQLLRAALADPQPQRKRPWLLKNWIVLCPLEGGLTVPARAQRVLNRVEGPEFSGRWGLYVNSLHRSPPMSISTGVLAVAETVYGRAEQALRYLNLLSETLGLQMPGAIAEFSPDSGCFVQAWSGYGIAWSVVAGMFGLKPDAFHRQLTLTPCFPASWSHAQLSNVRIGDTVFDFRWDGERLWVNSRERGWSVTTNSSRPELKLQVVVKT